MSKELGRDHLEGIYRAMVEHANDGICVISADSGAILSANPAFCRMYGYSAEEIEGMPIFDLRPPDAQPAARKTFERVARGERVVEELVTERKSGELTTVEIRPVLIELAGERFMISIVRDVSAHKRVDEALRDSETKYRDFVENAFDIINSVDAEGNIVEANQKMGEVLGYPREDLIGMNVSHFVAPEHLDAVLDHIRRTLASGAQAGLLCDWIDRDGRRVPVEINSTGREGPSGKLLTTRCIVRDISERRRLEQQLIDSETLRAGGEAAAGVGHNFNNLLTAILFRVQAIRSEIEKSEDILRDVSVIEALVGDAKTLSARLQPTETPNDVKGPVDVNRLIHDTVEMTRSGWQRPSEPTGQRIRIETRLEATALVAGRAVELREVLTNLVNNAVEAMPRGGTVSIETSQSQTQVVLSVTDTGIGMGDETRRRLFEPFFTTKEAVEGRGLGLFTVYRVVRDHCGEIETDSTLGEGTTFRVRLPVHGRGR